MIRIAITDDHPAIAEGIRSMFGSGEQIRVVAIYSNGAITLESLPESGVDVLLLDIDLPDMDGLGVCKTLKKKMPDLRIIAFTSYNETGLLRSMFRNGASGFLLKNSTYDEISEAIHMVYHDQEFIQKEMKELILNESLNRTQNNMFIPKLTRREKEILSMILDENTSQQIAEKLFLSPKTVETHRLNLLQKLGVKNTAGLVKVALEKGLL
jgi:DNA-binding NarL/FixJ family response regulator